MTESREQEVRNGTRFYRRISLELSHTWPGEMYLRFETGPGMAVMVGVTPADLDEIRPLLGARSPDCPRCSGGNPNSCSCLADCGYPACSARSPED